MSPIHRRFDLGKFAEDAVRWLAQEVERAGAAGGVLGLSGGLDSAVTAALATRALGERALGLVMPCESRQLDEEHARLVARATGLRVERVSLDAAFAALAAATGCSGDARPPGRRPSREELARANLKPRLRMATLYCYANRLSYLVIGTSNKSELLLGYFTKHGDGAADILPLGALYKTEVRELARALGIPREVIEKPPSAGLWEGQTTEGELGLSYDDIDAALQALESGAAGGVRPEVLERVRALVAGASHKRAPAPVFLPPGAASGPAVRS